MLFFSLFLFFLCFASNDGAIQTVIVQMRGNGDGGFEIFDGRIATAGTSHIGACINRYKAPLNPQKTFHERYIAKQLGNTISYTDNLPFNNMDLGGPNCVQFFKGMILYAYEQYPDADIILAGSSQGSVGPFGALAQLAQEKHPVINRIKKVVVEAVLGSIHETINFHARKSPILKILPLISEKIAPLIAEYFPRFIPGFAKYNAFTAQMYHYIEQINQQTNLDHIQFLMLHDANDPIIPCSCAHKACFLLQKNKKYVQTTIDPTKYLEGRDLELYGEATRHIPTNDLNANRAVRLFLGNNEQIEQFEIINQSVFVPDTFFITKSPFERFAIRRMRDVMVIALLWSFYKVISLAVQMIKKI